VTHLIAGGTVNAILYGGSGSGSTLSATGSGNSMLISGGPKAVLSNTGTGYNILIGGPGTDTLTANGNDILISGTTNYDSNTSTNIAALDAILAEWSSGDVYATRISKIMNGIKVGSTTVELNATTCQSNGVANKLSDGTAATQNNWVHRQHEGEGDEAGKRSGIDHLTTPGSKLARTCSTVARAIWRRAFGR
jgi:hypothetical protein